MYRSESRGEGCPTSSESLSSSSSDHPPVDSDSGSRPTPEEELQSYKRPLSKSVFYFFSDEEFLEKRWARDNMCAKCTARKPSNEDHHVAQRVATMKRPIFDLSSSYSLRSRKKQKSSPCPGGGR